MSTIKRISHSVLFLLALSIPLVSSASPPTTPEDFHYEIYSNSTVELFWLRTTNVPIIGYEIAKNGEILGVFDSLSYLDNSLEPLVDYFYTITAVGSDGVRSGQSRVSFRTPKYADTIASLQQEVSDLEQELVFLEGLLSGDGGVRSPVPQTGQKISIYPGDDGDFQAGVTWPEPRLTLNVETEEDLNENEICDGVETCNGTVTDNLTGLVWLQNANCFDDKSWYDAVDEINALQGDGSSNCGLSDDSVAGDWRLPNIREMQSLMDYGHSFPTALLPSDHPFLDVQLGGIDTFPSRYWTSTSIGSANDGVYTVSVSVGWVERLSIDGTDFESYTWPVRNQQ